LLVPASMSTDTLSLHDALPIWRAAFPRRLLAVRRLRGRRVVARRGRELRDRVELGPCLAFHRLEDLHGVDPVRDADAAAEERYALGAQRDERRQLDRDDVACFDAEKVGEPHRRLDERRVHLDLREAHLLANRRGPTLVASGPIALQARVEQLS